MSRMATVKDQHGADRVRTAAGARRRGGHPLSGLHDALGNRGMQRLAPKPAPKPLAAAPVRPGTIQRACDCKGAASCNCAGPHALPWLQRQANDSGPAPSPAAALHGHGSGHPLDASSRAFMEPRFGHDLGGVRLHTDTAAAHAAKALHANAFTVGRDVYFAEGKHRPDTHAGRRLLAHELTHTIQQGGADGGTIARSADVVSHPHDASEHEADRVAERVTAGAAVSLGAGAGSAAIQREPSDGGSIWDDITGEAKSLGTSVVQGVEHAGSAVGQGVTAVGQAASGALSWIETQAGKLALAAANALAERFGGTVHVVGTGIIITIPDMQICTPQSMPVLTMPMMSAQIPIWGWAGVFGPVGVGAAAGFRFGIQPSLAVSYGPCRLRDMSLQVDPLAGTYAGTAQLYLPGAVTETATTEATFKALGVVGLVTPPAALMASVEGGLRGTFRGSAAGALQETVKVAYTGGAFSLDLLNTLKLGAQLELDLDFFANASLYDFTICEYVLPLASWRLASKAERYDLPVAASGGGVSIGPVTSRPIPFSDIAVFINRQRPQTRCLSLEQIHQELCRRGFLPGPLCRTKPDDPQPHVGPHVGPMPVGPHVGPMPVGPHAGQCGTSRSRTPEGKIAIERGPFKGKTIDYEDPRGKHTKVADCPVSELSRAARGSPDKLKGELKRFVEACARRDTSYGSQLGSAASGKSDYERLVKDALENGRERAGKYHHAAGFKIGYDVADRDDTAKYRVDVSVTGQGAHVIPLAGR